MRLDDSEPSAREVGVHIRTFTRLSARAIVVAHLQRVPSETYEGSI
jgi:hypothetical protein